MQDAVLVTGGAGYVGSHTSLKLLEAGRKVVILDDSFVIRLPRIGVVI